MIDWSKPLELTDGTPVGPYGNGVWPDADGQYHVARADDGYLVGFFNEDGTEWKARHLRVRNRAPAEDPTELRDRFAMAALTGFAADEPDTWQDYETMAVHAYRIADAMIEARKK